MASQRPEMDWSWSVRQRENKYNCLVGHPGKINLLRFQKGGWISWHLWARGAKRTGCDGTVRCNRLVLVLEALKMLFLIGAEYKEVKYDGTKRPS